MVDLFFASLQYSWFDAGAQFPLLLAEASFMGWVWFFGKILLGLFAVLIYISVVLTLMEGGCNSGGGGYQRPSSDSSDSYESPTYEPSSSLTFSEPSENQGCGWGNTRREDFGHGP